MSETKILEGLELLKHLSLVFGPTGSEEAVADEIVRQLENTDAQIIRDRMNNVFAVLHGKNRPEKTVMLSAHMDEVGFIIKDIDGDGYVRFACLGGIDSRVLCGRKVTRNVGKFIAQLFKLRLYVLIWAAIHSDHEKALIYKLFHRGKAYSARRARYYCNLHYFILNSYRIFCREVRRPRCLL